MRYWDTHGAIDKLLDSVTSGSPDGHVIAVKPSPRARDVLDDWERRQAEVAKPDLEQRVDHWLLRRWGGVALIFGVRYVAPLAAVKARVGDMTSLSQSVAAWCGHVKHAQSWRLRWAVRTYSRC